jgi:nitroreductase
MDRIVKQIRQLAAIVKYWGYDIVRFKQNLNYIPKDSSFDKIKGSLIMNYHVIEKGLTMPQTRLGFGYTQIRVLLNLIKKYDQKQYPRHDATYLYCHKILKEYVRFHNEHNFPIDASLSTEIDKAVSTVEGLECASQLTFQRNDYFKHCHANIGDFLTSRYSVRNYIAKEISDETILKCVQLASKSPSSCNRQPVRAYFVRNEQIKQEVLSLQSGNRGFGHLANIIIVITCKIDFYQDFTERHELALNAGMFSMSLLLALHNHEIAACPLNWSVKPEKDKKLKEVLNIPDSEMINLIISCGYTPDEFQVACSPRDNAADLFKIV